MVNKIKKILLSAMSIMVIVTNMNVSVLAEDVLPEATEAESIQENEVIDETDVSAGDAIAEDVAAEVIDVVESTTNDVVSEVVLSREWNYEDDEISVVVKTKEDALPEDSALFVTRLDDEKVDELQNEDAEEAIGYDIGFTKDGEEVEPTSEAQVSIQLKTLEEVDVNSMNVEHITDDENKTTVANKENISEEDGVINTTFTTDSFSYFIINYNNNYKIYAHLIDTEGTEFPASESDQLTVTGQYDQANFYNWNRKENVWVEVKTLVATYGEFTNGYSYLSTHVGSADGEEMKWIYYSTSRNTSSGKEANTWYYSTANTMPTDAPTSSTPTIVENSSVYCIYTKDYESDAEIQDNVHEDGSLFLPRPADISENANVTYKWYRCTEKNGEYQYAKRTKVTGGNYTVVSDATGSHLYSALDVAITDEYIADQSTRFWYKVEVYVDGELYKTTGAVQNQYYAALQNGSFENVDTQKLNYGQAGSFIPEGTTRLGWKTTGTDHQLEVVYAPNASSSYGVSTAPDGNQFAELNAEAAGALYQDIMATPGNGLYWKIYHRARTGTDTMYLVIAPTKEVENITTQSELLTLVNNIQADEDSYAAKGYYLQTISDSTSSWGEYTGTYDVLDDVYLTRLFFIAGNTGSGHDTAGNFIDAVAFSSLMPEPDAGQGNLTVSKTVTGLLDTDIANYSLRIDVLDTKNNKTYSKTMDFSKATKGDDGSYTLEYSVPNLTAGVDYRITETVLTNVDDLSVKYETIGSSCEVNGEAADFSSETVTVNLKEDITNRVDIENVYKPENSNLVIKNEITGNIGNKHKDFEYTVTITDTNGTVTKQTFTLQNDDEKTISVPYGAKVEVTQTDYSDDGYSTYYKEGDDDTPNKSYTVTIDSQTDNEHITFVNGRYSSVPTGAHNTSFPSAILFGLGILLFTGLVFKKYQKD